MEIYKPQIIRDEESLNNILRAHKGTRQVDAYKTSLRELFFAENPQHKSGTPEVEKLVVEYIKDQQQHLKPEWLYFPWSNTVVKNVPEDIYFKLRTARNRDIITEEEQLNYRNTVVGIIGLSVGSRILSALIQSGGPKNIKVADFDIVEVTNLNRIQAHLTDVGTNKTLVASREAWEIDPYTNIEQWQTGVSGDNIEKFIMGAPKIDFLVDEMDDIQMKIRARLAARENRIPTIMATDTGDSVILDIERYDLEPKREIFHGLIGTIDPSNMAKLDYKGWLSIATKIIGPEYLPLSMHRSLLNIGKTIASVPQLGTTAFIAGAVVSYAIRKMGNKENMPSGRYIVNLDENLSQDYNSSVQKQNRKEKLGMFLRNFGK